MYETCLNGIFCCTYGTKEGRTARIVNVRVVVNKKRRNAANFDVCGETGIRTYPPLCLLSMIYIFKENRCTE